jgi:uridine kinase
MSRAELLQALAEHITALERPHPLRVAIDGVDAAGKTTLADELVRPIEERGRPVIRASIDGFHRPRAERYRRGPNSPAGYYHDSFDYAAVRAVLLDPLGPGGNRRYRRALFDWRSDAALDLPPETAPDDAVLLFDGIFLQRPELVEVWDLRIFLQVAFDEVLRRAVLRDGAGPDDAAAIHERYHERYIPGQQLYLEAARPQERADILVDNNDPAAPRLIFQR